MQKRSANITPHPENTICSLGRVTPNACCRYLRNRVPSPFRFAISASFTAEPIHSVIEFWGRRLNADFEVRFAPYNQLPQTLLDPSSVFGRNPHGINVLFFRWEDLGEADNLEPNATELARIVRDTASSFSVPVLICLCPSTPEFLSDPARAQIDRRLRSRLLGWFDDFPGVQFIDAEEVCRQYPVGRPTIRMRNVWAGSLIQSCISPRSGPRSCAGRMRFSHRRIK